MINGLVLKDAFLSGANNIAKYKAMVDDLNIFPVPDGDTGTNMSMTMLASAKELVKIEDEISCSELAKKNASALLRGARGNSGVITSLLFRGFAKGLEGLDEITGSDLANALTIGVDAAYKAVMKPTEGTILTVSRVAAEQGRAAAVVNNDVVYVWKAICDGAYEALATTPDLLPVLKKAGVVDAGGQGLCFIFDGMRSVFENGVMIENDITNTPIEQSDDSFRNAAAEFDQEINFTYCTEFIVGRNNEIDTDPLELRAYLETIGDCVLVVDDDEIIKVHVHTENPGNALQKGLEFGQLLTVKIENMKEQHKNNAEENFKKKVEKEPVKLEFAEPTEDFGFVAVAAGEGLATLFSDLGCTHIVSGGQTMNPSTDDLYNAIMATPAKVVYVLPNNKNIIMAAEQTIELCKDRKVIVIPSKTIPQGLSAMLGFDASFTDEENIGIMTSAMANVSTGQVTFAARDSEFGGHKIKDGDIMGLDNGKLVIVDKDVNKVALKLTRSLVSKDTSFITVIYGEDVSDEDAESFYNSLQSKLSDNVEITLVRGGQPVYYYTISVE